MNATRWGLRLLIGFCTVLVSGCGRLCESQCADEGLCSRRNYRAGDALYRCYAGSDTECAGSRACADEGRCFATEQGTCVVEGEVAAAACSRSELCGRSGQCGHRDGTCWADSDAACAESVECRTVGRCRARGGVCIPFTDADCEQSLGCEVEGLCQLTSYLRMSWECRVPLDDPTACQQSWVCEHYGRCEPARTANCENCRYGFCAEPGAPGVLACSAAAAVIPPCSVDGRCAPDANNECAHAPIGGPGAPGPQTPVADRTGTPSADKPPTPTPPPPVVEPPVAAPPVPSVEPTVPAAPPGRSEVAYDLAVLDDVTHEGTLTHAVLLTGAAGFEAVPVDFLVFRATPAEGCSPSARSLLPLGAIWLMGALPAGEGSFVFEGGPMPGQMAAKTWLWTGDGRSGSYNLALHGSIVISSRSATEVRGTVEFRVTQYFSDAPIGTVRGPFVADVVDCSNHQGGWPM